MKNARWMALAAITLPLSIFAYQSYAQTTQTPAPSCTGLTGTAEITCLAQAFEATLTDTQKATLVQPFEASKAIRWSNLPCGLSCRNGLQLSDLSVTQKQAALALVYAATGHTGSEGYTEVQMIRDADDVLQQAGGMSGTTGNSTKTSDGTTTTITTTGADGTVTTTTFPGQSTGAGGGPSGGGTPPSGGTPPNGGTPPAGGTPPDGGQGGMGGMSLTGYGADVYDIAFIGEPTTTGTWMLQFGGHHLAINATYNAGKTTSFTPHFQGIEPKTWTQNGKTYAPMVEEQQGMLNLLNSLSSEQHAQAKLTTTFSDVILGPGNDGKFPATKVGVKVGTLSDAQKKLVLEAIKPWVLDADDATAAEMLKVYESEMDDTYVSFSGSGTLTQHADYVRIDGPSVWIEFVCQNGIVIGNQIHYHSIWRDHTRDYGASFKF